MQHALLQAVIVIAAHAAPIHDGARAVDEPARKFGCSAQPARGFSESLVRQLVVVLAVEVVVAVNPYVVVASVSTLSSYTLVLIRSMT